MNSRNGYTEEQMNEAIDMYQNRSDLRVADIAERLNISDPSTISHWVRDKGLPLRVPKPSGWLKDSTTSHMKAKKMVTCPECGKRYKPRDNQKFCHLCGADITPIEDKCKSHLKKIKLYYMSNFNNVHTLQHPELVARTKEFVKIVDIALEDLGKYFNMI